MKPRQRVPTIFNVYMVDVLCCALGCVILLWLVKSYYAEQEASVASEKSHELVETAARLKKTDAELLETLDRLKLTRERLEEFEKKYKDSDFLLAMKKEELEKLKLEFQKLAANFANKEVDLKKANIEIADLQKVLEGEKQLLVVVGKKIESLEKDVKNKNDKLLAANIRAEDLSDKLVNSEKVAADLEALIAKLQKDFALKLDDSKAAMAKLDSNLDKKDKSLAELTKELNELLKKFQAVQLQLAMSNLDLKNAKTAVTNLQTDNLELLKKAKYLQLAADSRFAGLSLTGQKVIFMVDISRSMRMTDEKNDDTEKWPWVCETIGKVLKSMPNVTHFQVITFSEKVSYPLGGSGQWLVYNPESSAKEMVEQLKKIQPTGGTKMTPAFNEAFRYKTIGLDTIYLISDGLPNDDENLPPEIAKLQGVERSTYLSNRVRHWLKTYWNPPVDGVSPVSINALGFFFESPEVGAFLWALARENNGNFVGMSKESKK
jgi:hypothetical protein